MNTLAVLRQLLYGPVLLLLLMSNPVAAQEQKFVAQLHANTPQELADLLDRAESWAKQSKTYPKYPIAIVLHGPEVDVFIKKNYGQYQSLVWMHLKWWILRFVSAGWDLIISIAISCHRL